MHILALDFGNSRIKAGIFLNETPLVVEYLSYTDNIAAYLTFWNDRYSLDAVGYSNVQAKNIHRHYIDDSLAHIPWIEVTNLSAQNIPGMVQNCYAIPEQLGADRLAAAVGAWKKRSTISYHESALLIIDIGTSITYDYISPEGLFIGGAISLGVNMRFRALHQFTSRLPLITTEPNVNFMGTDTKACILSGVIHGVVGEIHAFIDKFKIYANQKLTVIATGGGYEVLQPYIKGIDVYDPSLVTEGIYYLTVQNVQNSERI